MQIPNKGQPIDYSYFTEIVNSINKLEAKTTTKSSIAETIGDAKSINASTPTNNVVIYTGYIAVSNDDTTKAHQQSTSDVQFKDVAFLKPPIVTVTPVSSTAQSIPEKVVLGLSNVTQTGCTVNINFLDKDIPSIGINIIAIGLPVV